ncbi:MAG: ATP-binding protein [Elusimicrobia bacterium]|nr:ATP-binding protein [Elusimicrobiota bacterium]
MAHEQRRHLLGLRKGHGQGLPIGYEVARGFTVIHHRAQRLFEMLAQARGDGSRLRLIERLGLAQMLIVDDFLLTPLNSRLQPQQ